jgi:hypothetical protein
MIDPDLEKQLIEINTNLNQIKKHTKVGIWRSFFNGMFGALGYIAGVALVVVILGWFLQKTGLLEPFKEQVKNFSGLIQAAQKLIGNGNNDSQDLKNNPQNNRGAATNTESTIVTLPNGQQIRVNIPQYQQ